MLWTRLYPRRFMLLAALPLLLSACAETQLASHYAKQVPWPGEQTPNSTYKVGKPYKVAGDWYYPSEDFSKSETGIASWYGPTFHGKRTANGEIYDQNELTAAHRTLQMPSLVRVTNLDNGRAIVVRVNDRGPFKRGRVIDVSKRSAELLGFINQGTARVRLDVMEKESRRIAAAAQQGHDTSRITLADLERFDRPVVVAQADIPRLQKASVDANSLRGNQPGGRFAVASSDPMMPESLRTPTITVEQLNRGMPPVAAQAPQFDGSRRQIATTAGTPVAVPAPNQPGQVPFSGHTDNKGRFMPDDVVQKVPVAPTGLFVQAGSFGVRENAERMKNQLSAIAPTTIEQININGRQLYRVKLGPLADLAEADAVLSRVTNAGTGGARVVQTH